jgi:hypothetical protein
MNVWILTKEKIEDDRDNEPVFLKVYKNKPTDIQIREIVDDGFIVHSNRWIDGLLDGNNGAYHGGVIYYLNEVEAE